MSNYFCANCNWQGQNHFCPLCGETTETLQVEEHSGLPLDSAPDLEFAQDFSQVPLDDIEDDL